jgi:hypothetical protein
MKKSNYNRLEKELNLSYPSFETKRKQLRNFKGLFC